MLTRLEENLECFGDECSLDTIRRVKLQSDVGIVYLEFVKPPCVHLPFDKSLKTIKQSGGEYAACAHKKTNDIALASCCQDSKTFYNCTYSGERVSYSVADSRCTEQRGEMCWFNSANSIIKEWPCKLPYDDVTMELYWTNASCKVLTKGKC